MAKSDPSAAKRQRNKTIRWVITIFLVTILISGIISFVSDITMRAADVWVAFVILLAIVLLGIVFDIVGVAVTSADEKPFHSMAARKVPGAQESIMLLRRAEKVSSICNDVIGDICGVISGAAAAAIALKIIEATTVPYERIPVLIMSALVAGLTVGGKAIGKSYAIGSCTNIVHTVGKVLWFFRHFPRSLRKK